jgi:hypothetical protein
MKKKMKKETYYIVDYKLNISFLTNLKGLCCNVKRLRKRFIDLSLYLELKERYMSTRLINPAKGKYKVRNRRSIIQIYVSEVI